MDLERLFKYIVREADVSDLHFTIGQHPIVRLGGKLTKLTNFEKINKEKMAYIKNKLMDQKQIKQFSQEGELDFSYSIPGLSRFRVNVYHQRGSIAFAIRLIPTEIPNIDDLKLPEIVKKLALKKNGLVLCTGPTGSGKSTTLASMINLVNETKSKHILTLEDPIEYLHDHKKSIVHQREVGDDTKEFSKGLRAALRQDPDIILIGEMRDLETISIALKAAETGHLVLATLHTNSASSTINRIVDSFPSEQQDQIQLQLASSLRGIISQQLLPRKDTHGRVAALEILTSTPAVQNLIREGNLPQLDNAIQTGAKHGMISIENHLKKLFKSGKIDISEVLTRVEKPDRVKKDLGL